MMGEVGDGEKKWVVSGGWSWYYGALAMPLVGVREKEQC